MKYINIYALLQRALKLLFSNITILIENLKLQIMEYLHYRDAYIFLRNKRKT
jgi:hypothetical protein